VNQKETPEGPFLYFAYGSNLSRARLAMHAPSAYLISVTRLADYRLTFTAESKRTWLGGVGDIVSDPGDEVWGALWLIAPEHSQPLDEQEGLFRDPPAYRRIAVQVETPAGDLVTCRSYQVVSPNHAGFLPSPAYKETILRGAEELGLPAHYMQRLREVPDNGVQGGSAH
jgi:gamma-glutamylcyclotransferase